jgi:hypothetical protein
MGQVMAHRRAGGDRLVCPTVLAAPPVLRPLPRELGLDLQPNSRASSAASAAIRS